MTALTAGARKPARVVVVSAADRRFFPLLQAMLHSLRCDPRCPPADLACFDIGLDDSQRRWLAACSVEIAEPGTHLGVAADRYSAALRSFLARPFLPSYFPGYEVYVWIDSDVWFQDAAASLADYIAGARATGFAITHESERAYRLQPRLFGWTAKHFLLGYGMRTGAWLLSRRHLNAGFFAAAAGAPHWAEWARRYRAAIERTDALVPHDQFALVHALHGDLAGAAARLPSTFLDPVNNWICDRGVPMWNDAVEAFCQPYPPYRRIRVLHLAGPAKHRMYAIRRTAGGRFTTALLPGATPDEPVVSRPGTGFPVTALATAAVAP